MVSTLQTKGRQEMWPNCEKSQSSAQS